MAVTKLAKRPKTRLEKYRSSFLVFNVLNSVSFMLLSGNIPTLFALDMGANGTYIGFLGALNFITYFFMPLGRSAIRSHRIIGVFGWSWMIRYIGMVPALIAPFIAIAGYPFWGLALLLIGSTIFNIFRGIGLIGNNPVLGMMAGNKDRGAFLSDVQITNSLTAIFTSVGTMFILGYWTGNILYAVLIGVGILTGCWASGILLRLPEPKAYRPPKGSSFMSTVKTIWSDKRIWRFVAVFAPLSFAAGTARTFIVTHARVLYNQNAGLVMAYYVAFNIGSVASGYLAKKLMDRLGSKPIYILFTAMLALSLIPAAWSPVLASNLYSIIFLSIINFLIGLAICGEENAGQAYFFSIVKPEHMVDLAIVYYIVYGLGGAAGSLAGGVFLDSLASIGFSLSLSYRILFLIILGLTIISTFLGLRLTAPDSASVRESLGVLFSVRDLKAIGILEKLEKSGSPQDEIHFIHELGDYKAWVAERELLPYLLSPRFEVRIEALLALENLEHLTPKALKEISLEVTRHPYTTAYVAARILGKHRWIESLPDIRNAVNANDYMLQCSAVGALAAMHDTESLPVIEGLLTTTLNPRFMISLASAIEAFGQISSVPILISVLKKELPPPYAFDEIVMAIAGILGGLRGFYRIYSDFLINKQEAVATLLESLDNVKNSNNLSEKITNFIFDGDNAPEIAKAIIRSPIDFSASTVLAEAVIDKDLAVHLGFRFLLAACAIEGVLSNE